ncbi:sugar ABC transporter ATP-binding protein [Paraburkholderia caffeinilytica]|uniref:Sugar ABC transporter ATP-binding protein n=1 Tax=Paraburkholderia caffeinilytica TaxID=1761016 RepID=A0ABQ1NC72_9BURK|nr:sn-glycerol-3-phosphate ABC transporter ATP-binding protein UgpC [Paraburkholderia caffeinilytica]AXL49584.1 sugar ABC transporter ATP-binding protein [Paraburkholderia caffeinilytica]GGC69791.1 sugar ABC transporter ATP-binding protein [Paraburkholderia caffeinilytica]CAB3809072.1 Oligosaccharides import ATP-binding protein MsmX [Paraburkholderia caffeinilytica]
MSSLHVSNVRKAYGSTEILREINIDVEDGDFLVLVGPSGCGKSTLLSLIAGLDTLSGGEIRIGADKVNDLHPSERDIAMVFQSYALYPNMTVGQNISFGLEMRKVPKPEREKAVQDAARLLQIEHLLDRRPAQLSGGQRQRVAMGRALVRHPKIFLFDEPLSNLDAKLRVDMRTEIKKLHQRLGATIVYVTHDQIEAMTLATRIAVMKGGILQQLGTPAEVYNTPANTFVATFMGSPSMNLIPARIEQKNGALNLHIGSGQDGVDLALPPQPAAVERYVGKNVIAGLRPEAIGVENERATSSIRTVPVKINVLEPTGPDTLAVLEFGGMEVSARLGADLLHRSGERCELRVDLSKLVLFDAETEARIH